MEKTTRKPPENQQISAKEIARKYGWEGKRAGKGGRLKTDCPLCLRRDPEALHQLYIWPDPGASGALKAGFKCDGGCHKTLDLVNFIRKDFGLIPGDPPPATTKKKKNDYGVPDYMKVRGKLRPQIKEYAERPDGSLDTAALRWLDYAILGLGKSVWDTGGRRRPPRNKDEAIVDGGGMSMVTLAEATLWRHRDKLLLVREIQDSEHIITIYTLDPESGTWRLAHHELSALIIDTAQWLVGLSVECLLAPEGGEGFTGLTARELAARVKYFARSVTRRWLDEAVALIPSAAEGLQTLGMYPEELRRCDLKDLDSTPGYIGAPNGIIKIGHPSEKKDEDRHARLLPPAEGKEKLITRMIQDPFVPEAKNPLVDKFSERWDEDMWIYFLEAVGHALWGSPDRCMYVLEGEARSGKTTIINAIRAALGGDYTSAPDISLLLPRGKHPSSHDAGPMDIVGGRLLAFLPEPESRAPISAEAVKQLAGNETITFRLPYGRRMLTRKISATIFMVTNPSRQPRFGLQEQAIQDRIRFIKHPPRLPDTVVDEGISKVPETDQGFRQALVALLVSGASATPWRPECIPDEATAAKKAAIEDELGILGAWIQEEIEYSGDPADLLTTDEIWSRASRELDGHYNQAKDLIDGSTRRRLTNLFSNLHAAGRAQRLRMDGKLYRGWRGYKFKNEYNPFGEDEGEGGLGY